MSYESDAGTVVRRWFEEVWNDRRDDTIEELLAPDAYLHVEGQELRGPDDFRRMRDMFFAAMSDVKIVVEDVLSDGDRAALRWRAVGTHDGEGFGFRATKQRVDVRGTSWAIVRDGKVVQSWDTWNLGALMQSLREAAS